MNKEIIAILFLSCFVFLKTNGQDSFQKVILEEEGISRPTSIVTESDGYIIASWGYSEENINGVYYRSGIKLLKTDLDGNLIWKRKYSEPGKGYQVGLCGSLINTSSGYLLGGSIRDSVTGKQDYCLFKLDSNGIIEWKKEYTGGLYVDNMLHGSGTYDKGYIMTGQTLNQGAYSNYFVVKTDSLGNQKWTRTYGGSLDDVGAKIHQVNNNEYVVSGSSQSYGNGGYDLWLIKFDSSGIKTWEKTFGTTHNDGFSYVSLADDGFIVWGVLDTVINNIETQYEATIVKLNAMGEVVWRHFFKHKKKRLIYQVKELSDGSIVAIGEQKIGAADSIAAWIAKLDSSGNILWERLYPGPVDTNSAYRNRTSFIGDFNELSDGFIVAGATWKKRPPVNIGFPEIWLVKLDSNGCFGPEDCGLYTSIEEVGNKQHEASILVYPNPSSNNANIYIKGNSSQWASEPIRITLYNLSGQQLYQESKTLNTHGYTETQVSISHLPPGVYVYSVTSSRALLGRGKIVVR